MNHADLIGVVNLEPQLRYSQDGQTAICEFHMLVPSPKKDAPPSQFPVQVFGDKAQVAHQNLKPGMEVKVQGSIRIESVDNGQSKDKVATIIASKINSLQAIFDGTTKLAHQAHTANPAPQPFPDPAPVAQPVAAGAPASGGGEDPNYDSIPF